MSDQTLPSTVLQLLESTGQDHVLRYWDELSATEKQSFAAQLSSLSEMMIRNRQKLIADYNAGVAAKIPADLEPAPYQSHPERGGDPAAWNSARAAGEAMLAEGKVAAFTVAGGQGTRLGYDGPKGSFPVTPLRSKTLFQVFAEKIRFARTRYGAAIPWAIMTSPLNDAATRKFFADHDFFGLGSDTLHFFPQGTQPAFDLEGNLILADKGSLALSPDGHGGSFAALYNSGVLDRFQAEGISALSYFQVDNPLVHILDPVFLGFHQMSGSEMSSKMLEKRDAAEKVGHFCLTGGKTVVVEYSDMPEEIAAQTTPEGRLRFLAGSIAIHVMDVAFARRVGAESEGSGGLPWHLAFKKIPFLDLSGKRVEPAKPNGLKFEQFVFDGLPLAQNPLILQTLRELEFSPVKNAEGEDSPKTCQADQSRLFARWLKGAGLAVETDKAGYPTAPIEISGLVAVDDETFKESIACGGYSIEE
jgi:UDP-N-acetylglucosamine/UDP-N-acetylgalactosamine diphosphorylase